VVLLLPGFTGIQRGGELKQAIPLRMLGHTDAQTFSTPAQVAVYPFLTAWFASDDGPGGEYN